VVCRALFVKGTGVRNAIVVEVAEFGSAEEKYVALTRPRRSIMVLVR
jgi:hypothetical protein